MAAVREAGTRVCNEAGSICPTGGRSCCGQPELGLERKKAGPEGPATAIKTMDNVGKADA